jgi:methylglyoxal reductase
MEYREIKNSNILASIIGLGTWAIGGGSWWGETDDLESVRTIHAAIDSGINLIDTAPAYGWGHSEEVVGKAIKGHRDKVLIATKCGLWWGDSQGSPFFEMEGHKVNRSLCPDTIRKELEMSLKRLQVDYIDLYQTHWQSVEPDKTPILETMECLLKMKDEGKIRCIGVSNASVPEIEEYLSIGVVNTNQPQYSMLNRSIEKDVLPYCIKNNIDILAYSPLEQGLLTGKIGLDRQFNETEYRNNIPWYKSVNRKHVIDMLSNWEDLLTKYNCTTSQLVIAWTAHQSGISYVLCGARHQNQVIENAMAGSLKLDAADMYRMRSDVEALGAPT